ncbi:transposase family protein [Arthrobacter oryzae]|uniref:transposase family protein n=1 Tax=Arthrobacter oryzae TaxID=409290 RepID=UPI00352D1485
MISTRVHSRRPQRLRDIPVAGPIEVVWAKRRFFCDEYLWSSRTWQAGSRRALFRLPRDSRMFWQSR